MIKRFSAYRCFVLTAALTASLTAQGERPPAEGIRVPFGGTSVTGNPTPGTPQPDPPNLVDRITVVGCVQKAPATSAGEQFDPNTPTDSRFGTRKRRAPECRADWNGWLGAHEECFHPDVPARSDRKPAFGVCRNESRNLGSDQARAARIFTRLNDCRISDTASRVRPEDRRDVLLVDLSDGLLPVHDQRRDRRARRDNISFRINTPRSPRPLRSTSWALVTTSVDPEPASHSVWRDHIQMIEYRARRLANPEAVDERGRLAAR